MDLFGPNEQNRGVLTVGRGSISEANAQLLGTCFALGGNLFVTAAHVTSGVETGLLICQSNSTPNLNQYQDTSDTKMRALEATIVKYDPIRDLCILRTNQHFPIATNIAGTDSVKVGDDLFLLGYPHCTQGRQVLTYQTTTLGAKVLIDTSGIKVKNIILNIQTRPGQSGSPIFNRRTSQIVAILIGAWVPSTERQLIIMTGNQDVNPDSLHQTTHAVSSEYLLKML